MVKSIRSIVGLVGRRTRLIWRSARGADSRQRPRQSSARPAAGMRLAAMPAAPRSRARSPPRPDRLSTRRPPGGPATTCRRVRARQVRAAGRLSAGTAGAGVPGRKPVRGRRPRHRRCAAPGAATAATGRLRYEQSTADPEPRELWYAPSAPAGSYRGEQQPGQHADDDRWPFGPDAASPALRRRSPAVAAPSRPPIPSRGRPSRPPSPSRSRPSRPPIPSRGRPSRPPSPRRCSTRRGRSGSTRRAPSRRSRSPGPPRRPA